MTDSIEHLIALALGHHQSGRLTEARALYLKVLRIDADQPIALHMLGLVALADQNFDQAVLMFEQALAVNPNNVDAACNLGVALRGLGRLDEAVEAFRRAGPEDATALYNLGLTLSDLGRPQKARETYEAALSQRPGHGETLNNLGNTLWDLGRLNEAEARYREALSIDPHNAEIHKTLGFLQLLRGDFKNGWENYAWRLKEADCPLVGLSYEQPEWQGESLKGKTLFVYHEQGLGDVIQFARYLPLLKAKGGRVVFEVQAPLYDLMVASNIADMTLRAGETPPAFDFHIPLLELPRLFGTTLETIPGETPYLKVSDDRQKAWAGRMANDKGFKVGLVWTGNPVVSSNPQRSIDPRLLKPLADLPDISLYSLQVGRDGEAREVFGSAITDLAPLLKDYADTAAAMERMDLVVSTCTSPVHMAGALGRPCWALLCKWPDWRWLLERDGSPWYPGMKLFRQDAAGDWSAVIERVIEALKTRSRE